MNGFDEHLDNYGDPGPEEYPFFASGIPYFPDVEVLLTGQDGNAFSIIGRVSKELRSSGNGDHAYDYEEEAMSGDYDHVLQTSMKWVTVV